MKAINLFLTLFLAGFVLTGCGGNSSSTMGSVDNGSEQDNSQSGTDNGGETVDPNITFSASYSNSTILGSGQLINYNSQEKTLELNIPFPIAAIIPDTSGVLPKYPHISFETDAANKVIKLSVPISHYVDLVENPTTLPNGRPLPGVNGGEPPSFGFPLGFLDMGAYGYAAFDSFSIFVESSLNLPFPQIGTTIRDQNDSPIGQIYWIPRDGSHSSGVFLSIRLPRELSVLLANAQ